MSQMADIPVNDIAPLAEVNDYSIYLFVGVAVVFVVLVVTIFFLASKKWRSRRLSKRALAYKKLQIIDFSDPKHAAYTISETGRLFVSDNERTERAYHNLFERLEPYKYAPNVEPINEETIGYYRLYLDIIDV